MSTSEYRDYGPGKWLAIAAGIILGTFLIVIIAEFVALFFK